MTEALPVEQADALARGMRALARIWVYDRGTMVTAEERRRISRS
jgi:hypothetical protein